MKKVISALECGINNKMVDEYAMKVIQTLQNNGYDGFIVGGGIRDLILKKTPKDFDVVTNATPEIIRKLFKRNAIIIGKRFKIVHIIFQRINYDKIINNRPFTEKHIIEISTYRSLNVNNHLVNEFGRIMVDNNYGKQSDDTKRRDFTINALYYDPVKEIIVDYHNGIQDLQNNLLKVIGNPKKRYLEDPVRILRIIRLSVKLDLLIERQSFNSMIENIPLLINENRHRLFEEMLKVLLSGSSFNCINKFIELGLPKGIFPLFDKIFFGKNKDELAFKMLTKTDERIKSHHDTSIIFVLSGLMWHTMNSKWQKLLLNGDLPRQTLTDAISQSYQFAHNIGITRNTFNLISEIWLLQFDFEHPTIKKISKITAHPRFRQGLHLYNLRKDLNEVDHQLNSWWNKFIEAETEEEKSTYTKNLHSICGLH